MTKESNTKTLTWDVGTIPIGETWQASFNIKSRIAGNYHLGIEPDSKVTYTLYDGTSNYAKVPNRNIVVDDGEIFNLAGRGSRETVVDEIDETTKVRVTKEIIPNNEKVCPDINLIVEMPPRKPHMDVVFALDTSGSMIQHANHSASQVMLIDPEELHKIDLEGVDLGNVRTSIVSWDDKVDNVTNLEAFDLVRFGRQLYALRCDETENTIYGKGLNEAVKVLTDNPPPTKYLPNTERIIIFVTGLSEFSPGKSLEADILRAKDNGYEVHTFGIGITGEKRKSEKQLYYLNKIAHETGGTPNYIDPDPKRIAINIWNNITEILLNKSREPVAEDIVLTDTLFPYLKVEGTTPNADDVKINPDGTTTVQWNIEPMRGRDTKTFTIHTSLQLSLPADVNSTTNEWKYKARDTTPTSDITYTWFTGDARRLDIPAGNIRITCGVPPKPAAPPTPEPEPPVTTEPSEEPAPKEETSAIPGFGAPLALFGLSAAGYILRRKTASR